MVNSIILLDLLPYRWRTSPYGDATLRLRIPKGEAVPTAGYANANSTSSLSLENRDFCPIRAIIAPVSTETNVPDRQLFMHLL